MVTASELPTRLQSQKQKSNLFGVRHCGTQHKQHVICIMEIRDNMEKMVEQIH